MYNELIAALTYAGFKNVCCGHEIYLDFERDHPNVTISVWLDIHFMSINVLYTSANAEDEGDDTFTDCKTALGHVHMILSKYNA
jgi:hypothetical protein